MFVETPVDLGFTPLATHRTPGCSRLMDWRRRYADHPGVLLLAGLVSEHVDEVLWLVNNDRKVLVTWRRNGGHLLVRRLLYGPPPSDVLIPVEVDGYDVGSLLERITDSLSGVGGGRLRADNREFRGVRAQLAGGDLGPVGRSSRESGGDPMTNACLLETLAKLFGEALAPLEPPAAGRRCRDRPRRARAAAAGGRARRR